MVLSGCVTPTTPTTRAELCRADASIAEAALPAPGATGATSVNLPGDAQVTSLFAPSFITQYGDAVSGTTTSNAAYKVRNLAIEADMQDWTPRAPVLMCGANDDPVVYHYNSNTMATYWGALPAGLVTNLDLTETPAGPFALIQGAWQQARAANEITVSALHSTTGPYCSAAALGMFRGL